MQTNNSKDAMSDQSQEPPQALHQNFVDPPADEAPPSHQDIMQEQASLEVMSETRVRELKDNLISTVNVVVKQLQEGVQSVPDFAKVNELLEEQTDDIWQMLGMNFTTYRPLRATLNGQPFPHKVPLTEPPCREDEEVLASQKKSFYETLLGSVVTEVMKLRETNQGEFMIEIFKFFRLFFTHYMVRDPVDKVLLDLAAAIFDTSSNLHVHALIYKQPPFVQFDYRESEDRQRVGREAEWRMNSLKVGDKVDVIRAKAAQKPNSHQPDMIIYGWTIGTVVAKGKLDDESVSQVVVKGGQAKAQPQTNTTKVVIQFSHISKPEKVTLDLMDHRYSALHTFTENFEWRFRLKTGDFIDALDECKDWYESTVTDTRTLQIGDESILQVHVAYRRYVEGGEKIDQVTQKRFKGYGPTFDVWMDAADIQIQPSMTCCQYYNFVEKQHKQYFKSFLYEDKDDVLFANHGITNYTTQRKQLFGGSQIIADSLNAFGRGQGYQQQLELLEAGARGEVKIPLDLCLSIGRFFSLTMNFWTRIFSCSFIPKISDVLLKVLSFTQAPEAIKQTGISGPLQDDSFDVKDLDRLIGDYLEPLLKRHFTIEKYYSIEAQYRVELCTSLLHQTTLVKRIHGLKYLNESIKQSISVYPMTSKPMQPEEMIALLRKKQIFGLIFGEGTHFQLVHRSKELIKLFFNNEPKITPEEIDQIWTTSMKSGHQISHEVFRIIAEVLKASYNSLTPEVREHFLDKFFSLDPDDLTDKTLDLITELGKKIGGNYLKQSESSAHNEKSIKILWEIATLKKPYDRELAKLARKKFCEQMNSQEEQMVQSYVAECLQNIGEGSFALQNWKIFIKLIENMATYRQESIQSRSEFVKDLLEHQDLMKLLIDDLEAYISQANEVFSKGELTLANLDTYEFEGQHMFTHVKNLKSRLKRIKMILSFSSTALNSEQMTRLFDILVVKSELRDMDQVVYFNHFKEMFNFGEAKGVSTEAMVNLFETKVKTLTETTLRSIKLGGLECITKLFILVNEQKDKVTYMEQKHAVDNWQQQHWNGGAYQDNDDIYTRSTNKAKFYKKFRVNVLPLELEGIDVFWSMLECCDLGNVQLLNMLSKTLINIYTNLSHQVKPFKSEVYANFIESCLRCLSRVSSNSVLSERQKNTTQRQVCQLIQTFFDSSEEHGLASMQMHKQLEEGEFLANLAFKSQLGTSSERLQISVYDNTTFWDLKAVIARHTGSSPINLMLKREDTKLADIKEVSNSKLLRDVNLKAGEEITVAWVKQPEPLKAPLITKDKKLVPELMAIFKDWFITYSEELSREQIMEYADYHFDDEEELQRVKDLVPDSIRAMTRDKCTTFAKAITNLQEIKVTDSRVTGLFGNYAKTEYCNGNLILESEFLQFYEDNSINRQEIVRQNLAHRGILSDFSPDIRVTELNSENDGRIAKSPEELPRFRLLQTKGIFPQLLQLVESVDGEEADGVWNLLVSLPTNPELMARILNLSDFESLLGLSQPANLHQVLYCLQIIHSLVTEHKERQQSEVTAWEPEESAGAVPGPSNTQLSAETYEQDFPALEDEEPQQSGDCTMADENALTPRKSLQPSIPDAGQAIPLPYAGPFQSQGMPVDKSSSKQQEVIKRAVTRPLPTSGNLSDQDRLLRKEWLPKFLLNGGLSQLTRLLDALSRLLTDSPSKVIKRCLTKVMELLKILLLTTFHSRFKKVEEVYSSSLAATAPKSLLHEFYLGLKDMAPLLSLFTQRPELVEANMGAFEASKFQEQLLSLVSIYQLKKAVKPDEAQIVNHSLGLWLNCVFAFPELLNTIFNDVKMIDEKSLSEEDIAASNSPTLLFSANIVKRGIVQSDFKLRLAFAGAFRGVVQLVRSDSLQTNPLTFMLTQLLGHLAFVQRREVALHTKVFFAFLKELIPMYFDEAPAAAQAFDPKKLVSSLVDFLVAYESTETTRDLNFDHTLIGLIDTIRVVLEHCPGLLSPDEIRQLAKIVLEACLFSQKFEPLDDHITESVQLDELMKPLLNKCLGRESVGASYSLLLTLCRLQGGEGLSQQILEHYWVRQILRVPKPEKPNFQPRSEKRSLRSYSGLKNIGQICYMNSMLQQFFHVPSFRYCLLANENSEENSPAEVEGRTVDDNLLHQLMRQFAFMEMSERAYFNPRDFCFSFKDFEGNPTNVREQKDAHEFSNFLFDKLEDSLKRTGQKHLLDNVFGGSTCSTQTCKGCGNVQENEESFNILTTIVKNCKTLHESLTKFIQGEIIEDYRCSACNQKVDLDKKSSISKLPNTLVLHLQRLVLDFDTFRLMKINDKLEFPNVLNLRPYTKGEVLKRKAAPDQMEKAARQNADLSMAKEDSKQQEEEEPLEEGLAEKAQFDEELSEEEQEESDPDENYQYKLVGVVAHMGSADAGHYLSYINVERGGSEQDENWLNTEKQQWLEFNDTTVQNFNFQSDLEENCFGGHGNQSAYMLVYEKRLKHQMKVVLPVVDQLACDGTATPSAHLYQVFPTLFDDIKQDPQLVHSHENGEKTALLDFHAAKKFVPNSYYQEVHEDNKLFLLERQVFSESFFGCTEQLLRLSLPAHQDEDRLMFLFNVADRLLFDLMFNSAHMKQLPIMADLVCQILSVSDIAVEAFVEHRIFKPAEELGKDEKSFLESLATHQELEVRQVCSTLLIKVLNRLGELGGEERAAKSTQILQHLLAFIPNELSKHWMRIDTYFDFFLQLLKSNACHLQTLVGLGLISKMVEIVCKYNANSMLYSQAQPPFEKLVLLVSLIVRSIPAIVDETDYHNTHEVANLPREEGLARLLETRGTSKFHVPTEETFGQPVAPPCLPQECMRSLFIAAKSFKPFYQNLSKHGYESEEYSSMIAHLCYRNKEFSKKIAKHILKGTNSPADESQPYLQVMKQYLLIEDEFTEMRIEWIFGIAEMVVKNSNYQGYLPQVGVDSADSIHTQVCRYVSPLFKQGKPIFGGKKECALQALYSNRKAQAKAVLLSLRSILEAASEDPKDRILDYLRLMDPPTYQYARYWDWIKPWVDSEVQGARAKSHLQVYRSELEISIKVLSQLEQILQKPSFEHLGFQQDEPENTRLIEYPEDGGPKPYLIWKVKAGPVSSPLKEQPENHLAMWAETYECEVSQSFPSGTDNVALLDHFHYSRGQNNHTFQIRSQGGARNFKNRGSVFGRKRGGSRRGNQNRQQQREDHNKKLKARVAVETTYDENENDNQPGSDADSEVSNTQKEVRFHEDDVQVEGGEAELPNETGYRPEGLQGQGDTGSMAQDEMGVDSPVNEQDNPYSNPHAADEEEVDLEGKVTAQTLMVFKIQSANQERRELHVEFTILPKIDPATGQACPLNFRVPQSSIQCEIHCGHYVPVLTLTKLDPEADWGEFDWSYRVVEPALEQPASFQEDNAFSPPTATGGRMTVNEENQNVKECGVCTFHNPPYSTTCEICQTAL